MSQGELTAQFSLITLKEAYFYFKCMSNKKCLFSETVSPKHHSKVCPDKRVIRIHFLFFKLNFTWHYNRYSNMWKIIFSRIFSRKDFTTKLRPSFGVSYQNNFDVGMKLRQMKAKELHYFWLFEKFVKRFSNINDNVKSALQKWIISHQHVF